MTIASPAGVSFIVVCLSRPGVGGAAMDSFAISFGSFVLGVLCLVIGVSLFSLPAGLITFGLILLGFSQWPKR